MNIESMQIIPQTRVCNHCNPNQDQEFARLAESKALNDVAAKLNAIFKEFDLKLANRRKAEREILSI